MDSDPAVVLRKVLRKRRQEERNLTFVGLRDLKNDGCGRDGVCSIWCVFVLSYLLRLFALFYGNVKVR